MKQEQKDNRKALKILAGARAYLCSRDEGIGSKANSQAYMILLQITDLLIAEARYF